jgi:hypothetical protein
VELTEQQTRELALAFVRKAGVGVNDPGPPLVGGTMIDWLMMVIVDTQLTLDGKVALAQWAGAW